MTTTRTTWPLSRQQCAWLLIGWTVFADLLVALAAPSWLRVPVVGLYVTLAVGIAVVLVTRIAQPALAIGLAVAVGFASLILSSQLTLYTSIGLSAGWTIAAQSAVVVVLAAWVVRPRRPHPASEVAS